jgi:hypothetical protein
VGTSTVHRSPSRHPWDFERSAYENPDIPPLRVLDEILRAAQSDDWDQEMAGEAVSTCAAVLLERSRALEQAGDPERALVVDVAERRLITQGANSVFAEFALEGLAASLAGIAAGRVDRTSAAALVREFAGHVWVTAVRYAFLRDASGHVGGRRFATAAEVQQLATAMARQVRQRVHEGSLSSDAAEQLRRGVAREALAELARAVLPREGGR